MSTSIKDLIEEVKKGGNRDKQWIESRLKKLTPSREPKLRPKKALIGDIFFHGPFSHPCVVIARVAGQKNVFWITGLTSDEALSITELKTRYTDTSYVTNSLSIIDGESVTKTYRGSVSKAEAARIKTIIKQLIITI